MIATGAALIAGFGYVMGSRDFVFGLIGVIICTGILAFCIFGYAIPNIRSKDRFYLAVYADRIECHSPDPKFGPSFDLRMAEIAAIECDREWKYYIVAPGEKRFELTINYCNPVKEIVRVIQHTRPDLELRHIE